jgi:hypothetical protein
MNILDSLQPEEIIMNQQLKCYLVQKKRTDFSEITECVETNGNLLQIPEHNIHGSMVMTLKLSCSHQNGNACQM